MKTGIFGGTFNPVHCGHLINCEFLKSSAGLDRVIFIPAREPVHKTSDDLASSEHRCEMVSLAISGNSGFSLSKIEIERDEDSYTTYTLNALRDILPDDEIFLIIGSDSFNELDIWRDYKKIVRSFPLIVMMRPGGESLRKDILANSLNTIVAENPLIDISSSSIREQIKKGISVRYQVPDRVNDYILEKGLYRN